MTLATFVQPDFLAAAAAVVAVSCLLVLAVGPANIGWWIGLGVASFESDRALAAYLLLVSLISFPFTRYFVSLTLFLPSALCAQFFVMWRRILPATG